ncbi:BTB/POZ protein [Rhizophagus irregularis DAOM 181602=DAOM 197198]|nr:BTB/POZ protein [Rhizophagus irregularis DAOM 181602=DAOM 197198]
MKNNKFLPILSKNLLEILNDNEYYDVTIEVGNDPYRKNDGTLVHIKLPNISPDIFEIILRYIYGGSISLDEHDIRNIIDILVAEKLLVSLIQSDILQIDEIQVWNHVLKWGLAQNPELPSDPANFSEEDFDTLRNSLQNCIPHIRFYNLSSDEFSNEVLPYNQILPKELYEDLLEYFLYSDDQLVKNSKPLVKVKDSNEVLGGYNPIGWESNEFNEICDEAFSATKDSFIFSFNDINNIERFILSHIKNKEYAILSLCNFGPSFGGGDLDLYEDRGQCFNYDYEKPIREITKFSMEEYEVFQIIR